MARSSWASFISASLLPTLLCLLCLPGPFLATADVTSFASCVEPQYQLRCHAGCYNTTLGACDSDSHSDAEQQTEAECTQLADPAVEWRSAGCCTCWEKVCDMGCWDEEDENCLKDTNELQCAEIYGHVKWSRVCNCRFVTEGEAAVILSAPEGTGAKSIYFSVPAFVVIFRESLEVVIVLVIIVQFLHKARNDGMITSDNFFQFRREVYIGAGLGFLLCMVFGVGFLVLASLFRGLFKGDNLLVFDGVMMLITSLVLSFMAINFLKMIHSKEAHERKMQQQVEQTMARQTGAEGSGSGGFFKKHSFFILAFSTGLREGMESVIFLIGVVSDLSDLSSLPLPIVTGVVLSRIVGCCFFQGTKGLRVEWFLWISALILTIIAAGFFSGSAHKWQELDAFGTWSPKEERPWQNQRIWDARECCNDKTNRFFVLMRALVGWQDQPTPLEFFAYGFYWLVAISAGCFLARRVKRQMEEKVRGWREADAANPKAEVDGGHADI